MTTLIATGLALGVWLIPPDATWQVTAQTQRRLQGAIIPPVLASYPNVSVKAGGNTLVAPSAPPVGPIQSITAVAVNTNAATFTGTFTVNPVTGVVNITNAAPTGVYSIRVTGLNAEGTATQTFTLTVSQPVSCAPANWGWAFGNTIDNTFADYLDVSDVNNDGKQDLGLRRISAGIAILLGDGAGGFTDAPALPTFLGSFPREFAFGDFNGDGKQDLAIAYAGSNTLRILLGDGSGGFNPTPDSPLSLGSFPGGLATGDFNGDGKLDLIAAKRDVAELLVLLGDGNGGLVAAAGSPVSIAPAFNVKVVKVGDFNHDRKQDLVLGSLGGIKLLFGDGSGGFHLGPSSSSLNVGVSALVTGDFNGDNHEDIVASLTGAAVVVWLNDGSGNFNPTPNSPIKLGNNSASSIATGDFNADGKPDLAVTLNAELNGLFLLVNDGQGGFSASVHARFAISGVTAGDFNNDGKQDLAVSGINGPLPQTYLNNCLPTISVTTVTRQLGSLTSPPLVIANVNDNEDGPDKLTVAAVFGGTAQGVSINSIMNDRGAVTGTVFTSCQATSGTMRLRVTDSKFSSSFADLPVTITPNTPPVLSYANPPVIAPGAALTVNPAAGPADNGNLTSLTVRSVGAGFTGTVAVNSSGVVTINNAGPSGSYVVTLRATDNCDAVTEASFTLRVSCPSVTVNPAALPGAFRDSPYSQRFTLDGAIGTVLFELQGALPPGLLFNQTAGELSGTPLQVGDFSFTIIATDARGCIGARDYTLSVNSLDLSLAKSPASDQKPGSVLFYNIYTSATAANRQNTQVNLTNIHPSLGGYVHLFFVDGESCAVADSYLCLTANQTMSFLASDVDPGVTGYLLAVAVDRQGCPINFNYLIGDEYVKFATGHAANLGAVAMTALATELSSCNNSAAQATLAFDGLSYHTMPRVLAVTNLPSRVDGNNTLLILNRVGGNLSIGAATLTGLFGLVYNDAESSLSFSFSPGTCQFRAALTNNFPRITPRFEQFIPTGRSGWLKLYSQQDQGLLGAILNFNANVGLSGPAFNQGHNLHQLTMTPTASYTIPVFPPNC